MREHCDGSGGKGASRLVAHLLMGCGEPLRGQRRRPPSAGGGVRIGERLVTRWPRQGVGR